MANFQPQMKIGQPLLQPHSGLRLLVAMPLLQPQQRPQMQAVGLICGLKIVTILRPRLITMKIQQLQFPQPLIFRDQFHQVEAVIRLRKNFLDWKFGKIIEQSTIAL